MNKIGCWREDRSGLPCFEYTDSLPYQEKLKNGTAVKLPEDPWFLLGNYRLTLFTHVSGEYELISGQRSWMRMNRGEQPWNGLNEAVVCVDGKEIRLTGMDSIAADPARCKRVGGCGFMDYRYEAGGIDVERNLSVKPSTAPDNGTSSFVLTVTFRNETDQSCEVIYTETLGVNVAPMHGQKADIRYVQRFRMDGGTGIVDTEAVFDDPLLAPEREAMTVNEGYPPQVFMQPISEEIFVTGNDRKLTGACSFTLESGGKKQIHLIIGFAHDGIDAACSGMETASCPDEPVSAFAAEWAAVLPDFMQETDTDLRRELRWHAYILETMATWSEYYGEAKIPQGTVYDYYWGQHASARDNFQHALPLVYYNPALARSVLRYMLKRTAPWGEIRLIEYGNGYAANEEYFTSDQQLYFLLLLKEYLRVTGDTAILRETVTPYPAGKTSEMPVGKLLERIFLFLRDTISVGEHGLVRLLNSDWNDAVYYIVDAPYNVVFSKGESHMNTAMALAILQGLIPVLEGTGFSELEPLCRSMTLYRKNLLEAFLKDMDGRDFPRRMYFNGAAYGENNMFLEPQGFTLQIRELSEKKKRRLYTEMQHRVYKGERIGAREQENPEFTDEQFDWGSRENGGFWWALNGPAILGVASFDPAEARSLLENMTLKHLSESFPEYWCSWWSSADTLESSLIPAEGLTDQTMDFWRFPVFCAHPHAWILYCWYCLREAES